MAVAVALGATVAALVDVVVHALLSWQQADRGLASGLMLVAIMERLTWAGLAAVTWFAAPILSRWLNGGESDGARAVRLPRLFALTGRLMIAIPVLWVLGTWVTFAVKITLVGNWPTEGTVFVAAYYYFNLMRAYGPWLVGGMVVLVVSRRINNEATAA